MSTRSITNNVMPLFVLKRRIMNMSAVSVSFEDRSMYEYMRSCNEGCEDETALVCKGRKLSYGELFHSIEMVAHALQALGVKPGDTVALCSLSTPETIVAFYALNKIGATIASVDPRKPFSEVNAYMDEVSPRLTLMLDIFASKFEVGESWKGGICILLPLGSAALDAVPNTVSWADLLEKASMPCHHEDLSMALLDPDSTAVLMHTSGTTGFPKRVMLTNGNFNSIAAQYMAAFDFERQKTFLSIIPFFLCYGLNINVHLPLCAGVAAVLVPDFDASRFEDILIEAKANYVAGMPYFFEQLVQRASEQKRDLSFLEIVACGGDFLKPDAEKRLNAMLGQMGSPAKVIKGFGMTELCSTAVTCTPGHDPVGSVGLPLPLNEVRILGVEDDHPLDQGETGQICITGPSLMRGYLNDEAATEKVIFDLDGKRWIRTGDAGYLDQAGNLYVTGRIKRMFMRAQAKIYPEVIESIVSENGFIRECAVIGKRIGENESEPVAFAVTSDSDAGEDVVREAVFEACRRDLAPHVVPVKIIFMDALPLTSAGKIDYRALEEMA